mmetsp:Transcript_32058/g.74882  ORF Transcript_32058/g.74882 Transcript_32058/m.74882 type:complete len:274 (-) Transcript_32058:65-886(-)
MDPIRNQQRTGATSAASSSRAYPVASWSSFSSTASPVGSLSQTPVQVEHRPGGSVVGWPGTAQAARLAFTPPQPRSFPWPCVMSPVAVASGRVLVHTPPSSSTGDADSPNPGCLTPSRQVVCTVARQTTPAPPSTMSFTAARGLIATQAVPGITMSVGTLSSQSTGFSKNRIDEVPAVSSNWHRSPGSPATPSGPSAAIAFESPGGQPVSEASKKVSESQEKSTKERAPRPSPLSSHNQQACDLAETDFENGETKTLRPHLYYNYPTLGIYSG